MKSLEKHVDLFAGLGALIWAALATLVEPRMAELIHPGAAGAFAMLALSRWYRDIKKSVAPGVVLGLMFLVLLSACVNVPVYTASPQDERAVMEKAASGLGFGVDFVAAPAGAIGVEIVDRDHYHHGKEMRGVCIRQVTSTLDEAVLRHELGHALGLGHHDAPDNIMSTYAGDDSTEITKEQRQRMASELAWLRACRGAPT